MKLNIIPTPKIAMLCAAFCAALFAFNQNAHALTLVSATNMNWASSISAYRPVMLTEQLMSII